MRTSGIMLIAAGSVLFLSGCTRPEEVSAAGARPHYASRGKDIRTIGRIILVEPKNLSTHPQISADLANALSRAIERKNLFGQTLIYRNDPVCVKYQLEYEKHPLETLKEVHKAFGCNAILTGVVRDYQTYPRLSMSVQMRLVDIADGELIWAMEQVWDSSDKELEKRMKGFFDQEMGGGYEPLNWKMGLVSPKIFNKFVCYEIGETLSSSK